MNTLPDIRQIELVTGITIVGYIVEETEKLLAVETPFEIIRTGHTAEWALYLHMCEDDHIIDINKNHVICSFACNPHFKIQYIRMLDRLSKQDQEQPEIDDDDDDGDYVEEYDTNNNTVH
jgi:hypothetical protein